MSYSRWHNSRWYTFWRVPAEGTVENRDTAVFAVCNVADFTAHDLRTNLRACMEKVLQIEPDAEPHEMNELRGYVRRFLADVDAQYKR